MNRRWLRIAASASLAVVLAACTSGNPEPQQTPLPAVSFGFEPVAQYIAAADLGNGHTERIVMTFGAPQKYAEFSKTSKLGCPLPQPDFDFVVPAYEDIVNTSPAKSSPVMLDNIVTPAIDMAKIGDTFALTLESDAVGGCLNLQPAKNATRVPAIVGTEVTPWQSYSPPGQLTTNGTRTGGRDNFGMTTGTKRPPALEAVFLRLGPFDSDTKVTYRITNLKVTGSVAGMVTEGADRGAFYIPLKAGVSPCDSFAKDVKMTCGANLTAPTN